MTVFDTPKGAKMTGVDGITRVTGNDWDDWND